MAYLRSKVEQRRELYAEIKSYEDKAKEANAVAQIKISDSRTVGRGASEQAVSASAAAKNYADIRVSTCRAAIRALDGSVQELQNKMDNYMKRRSFGNGLESSQCPDNLAKLNRIYGSKTGEIGRHKQFIEEFKGDLDGLRNQADGLRLATASAVETGAKLGTEKPAARMIQADAAPPSGPSPSPARRRR